MTIALCPSLSDHSRLVRLVDAVYPGTPFPALTPDVLSDCLRYIGAGPDYAAQTVIQMNTVQSFLYLLHEAVELSDARAALDMPRPALIRREGQNIVSQDLWQANFSTHYSTCIEPADTTARIREAQAECALLHLFFGLRTTVAACVATLEVGPSSIPDAVEKVRTRILTALDSATPPKADCDVVIAARAKLFPLPLAGVRRRFANVPRTAYAVWQARGEVDGGDLADWFAASQVAEA